MVIIIVILRISIWTEPICVGSKNHNPPFEEKSQFVCILYEIEFEMNTFLVHILTLAPGNWCKSKRFPLLRFPNMVPSQISTAYQTLHQNLSSNANLSQNQIES